MESQQHARKKPHMEMDRLSNLPDPMIHHILSLMNTKYAVQTCVLSKKWIHHWTQIHSLCFDFLTFARRKDFEKFVRHVLRHLCKPAIKRMKFYCGGGSYTSLEKRIINFGRRHNLEELETDLDSSSPSPGMCQQSVSILKLHPLWNYIRDPFDFVWFKTIYIFDVKLENNDIFADCGYLENLFLIGCWVSEGDGCTFYISAPRLVNITISDFLECGPRNSREHVISAPGLKFLDFDGMYPPVLNMDECPALEKVNIHLLPPMESQETDDLKHTYVLDMMSMAERLPDHVKSLTVSLKFGEGRAVLHHNTCDSETKLVVLNKEIGKELLMGLAMVAHYFGKGCFSFNWQL